MRRPLLLGQSPSRTSGPLLPLFGTGGSGERLRLAANLSLREYLAAFRRQNLLQEWPGPAKSGTGDAFPLQEARSAAAALEITESDTIVCVGRAVADVMGCGAQGPCRFNPFFTLDRQSLFRMAWVPYPSGLNHQWNVPGMRGAVGALLGFLAQEVYITSTPEQRLAWVSEAFHARRIHGTTP